jgi:ketosteroid isomerase-like protein
MIRTVLGFALATVLSVQAGAQGSDSAKDEVIAAQKRFYEAYQACDAKAMAGLVTDDMWYFHSTGGIQHDKAEMLASLTPDCFIEVLRCDVRTVRIYGDTAVLVGDLHFKGKGTPKVAAQLTSSQVFVKQNGRWLFASNMSAEPVPLDTSVRLAENGQ